MTTIDHAPFQNRSMIRDGIGIGLLLAAIGLAALGFAWPWLPADPLGGPALTHYAPVRHGDARRYARYDRHGALIAWHSENTTVLPGQRAVAARLRAAARDALQAFYGTEDAAALPWQLAAHNAAVVEVRTRELDQAGVLTDTVGVYVREPRGHFQLSVRNAATHEELVFDPPLLELPADLSSEHTWESAGTLGDLFGYTYAGRVVVAGAHRTALGAWDDCRQIEGRLELAQAGTPVRATRSQVWICAGVGVVERQERDGQEQLIQHLLAVPDAQAATLPTPRPAVMTAAPSLAPSDPSNWQLTRVGRMAPADYAAESTTPPVWIPTDPPTLLVANSENELVAYDASDPTGTTLWRFQVGAPIYSAPSFDAARGRIYVGASDKRLYALDPRGLLLWSVMTGDNVAASPLIVDDVVIVGSEDRTVYGLDADTGAVRWTHDAAAAVVSSAARVGQLAVLGSDDAGIYVLDAATGAEHWLYDTDGPVEADVLADGDTVFVASRGGTVTALDPQGRAVRWSSAVPHATPISTAPLVLGDQVMVVDTEGYLTAFDRSSGQLRWSTDEADYVGSPVVLGDRLLVASEDGVVFHVDDAGQRQARWDMAGARIATDSAAELDLGPTTGDGAIWLADDTAVIWRLGPPRRSDLQVLHLRWAQATFNNPPFTSQTLQTTPALYGDRLVVLDTDRAIYLADPADGTSTRIGAFGTAKTPIIDPVVAGNTLLTVAGDTLFATRLPDGMPLWSFTGHGRYHRPPTVAGNTVLWLTQTASELPAGTMHALDLASGAVRWDVALDGFAVVGGAVVDGDTVYTSTPPAAWDLASGAARWRSGVAGQGLGGLALDAERDLLFVALTNPDGATTDIAALHAADGRERWRASLGMEYLNIVEQPWVAGDTVIVPTGADGGLVVGLDSASGAERWRYQPPVARWGGITVQDHRVAMFLENAQLVIVDAASGSVAARSGELGIALDAVDAIVQRPLIVDTRVFVAAPFALLGLEEAP